MCFGGSNDTPQAVTAPIAPAPGPDMVAQTDAIKPGQTAPAAPSAPAPTPAPAAPSYSPLFYSGDWHGNPGSGGSL